MNSKCQYLNIVMFEPEIPQNTGNVARLCACVGAKLWLVGRLGFSLSDKHLKRSGLDYWDKLEIEHILDFEEFLNMFDEGEFEKRAYLFTTKTRKLYTDVAFKEGDFLIFGPETRGLPEDMLNVYNKNCLTIPMLSGRRSLNLSNSVAIAAYEAVRQLGGILG